MLRPVFSNDALNSDSVRAVHSFSRPKEHAPEPPKDPEKPRQYHCKGCGFTGTRYNDWVFHDCSGTPQLDSNIG